MLEQYIYDGTFGGFLTCVFDYYDRKSFVVKIVTEKIINPNFLCEDHTVYTEEKKAARVWQGIHTQLGTKGAHWIYRGFLSEHIDRERILLSLIRKGFKGHKITEDIADPEVLRLSQLVKMVTREQQKTETSILFTQTKNDLYVATIEPDFDVLPLAVDRFKQRYTNHKWLAYDVCRHYGLYADQKTTTYAELVISKDINASLAAPLFFTRNDLPYQNLWKSFFSNTTLPSQKNLRLHLQQLPRRHWE